jgi:3-dehydroquinate synthase
VQTHTVQIGGKTILYHFNASIHAPEFLNDHRNKVLLTDTNVAQHLPERLRRMPCIAIPAGEKSKQQATADHIIGQMLEMGADKETLLVGIGGGVVTDLAGYVASIYMRGIAFGLVPTTLLAMVDAAIGGKNGVDLGQYKNLAGTIYQPDFIHFDYALTDTLPLDEWESGFAEIIKHACIADATLFAELQSKQLSDFRENKEALHALVKRNVLIKTSIVAEDEQGTGKRHLLNFGHTLGHPIELLCNLPHGHAVSIGMMLAAGISEEINGFSSAEKSALKTLLEKYGLPVSVDTDTKKLTELAIKDKKKSGDAIRFVLLRSIGDADVIKIPMQQLSDLIKTICC